MRKLFYILLVLLCLWVTGRAQVVEDTIALEAMLDTAFSELNLSYVPSGILIDKVPAYVDPTYFRDATPLDSIWLPGFDFALLYGMIDRAHVGYKKLKYGNFDL